MSEPELLETLRASGALKVGHFLLSSGRHSDQYIEKFNLLRDPAATSAACGPIATRYRGAEVDVVVGPTTGGIILAFEVARQLGVAAAYAERASVDSPAREFRRGTSFEPGQKVLVVDDIMTTGGSVRETLEALAAYPVTIAGVALLVDRSGGTAELSEPWFALANVNATTWSAEECPLCANGVPLTKPGTTPSPGVVHQEPALPD